MPTEELFMQGCAPKTVNTTVYSKPSTLVHIASDIETLSVPTPTTTCGFNSFLPYVWDSVLNKWRKTSDIEILFDGEPGYSINAGEFGTAANLIAAWKEATQIQFDAYQTEKGKTHRPIDDFRLLIACIKDSKAPLIYSCNYRQETAYPSYEFYSYGGKKIGYSQTASTSVTPTAGVTSFDMKDKTLSSLSQSNRRKLFKTSLWDIASITSPETSTYWRPVIGGWASKPENYAPRNVIPSYTWYLYSDNSAPIKDAAIKDKRSEVRQQYDTLAQQFGLKSNSQYWANGQLTSLGMEALLKAQLDAKQKERLYLIAREIFQGWYAPIAEAEKQGADAATLQALMDTPLEPIIQDAETTLNITERSDEFAEKDTLPRYLPYYILGGISVIAFGYLGVRAYDKRKKKKRSVRRRR